MLFERYCQFCIRTTRVHRWMRWPLGAILLLFYGCLTALEWLQEVKGKLHRSMLRRAVSGAVAVCMVISMLPVAHAEGGVSDGENPPVAVADEGLKGSGTKEDPYLISNLNELKWFRDDVNNGNSYAGQTIQLSANIDLKNEQWTPIGTKSKPFMGIFDGGNNTISNLCINDSELSYAGLFGYAKGAEIKNIRIANVDICAYSNVGAIAGTVYTGEVTNCHVSEKIKLIANYAYAAGIVSDGYVKVSNCSVIADDVGVIAVTEKTMAGGITGWLGEGNNGIFDCTVKNLEITAWTSVGAITGLVHYNNTIDGCTVDNIKLTKTRKNGQAAIGLASGNWSNKADDDYTITITNNSFDNISINGTAINSLKPLHGSNYSYYDKVIKLTERGNTYGSVNTNNFKIVAASATDLQNAVAYSDSGETITLLADIETSDTLTIPADKTITLDLNGKVIDGTGNVRIALVSYGNLTVKDSSENETGVIKAGIGTAGNTVNVCAGTFTLESGSIYSLNNAIYVSDKSAEVNINGGTITAEPTTNNSAVMYVSSTSDTKINITDGEMIGYNGILLWNNTEINMTGGSIKAKGNVGIQGNGTNDNTGIHISGDASVSGHYSAIYHPQGGELTITDNAKLTGWTGVVVKGGNVNISGGTISGTGTADTYRPVSSGYVDTGDGLYVEHYDNSPSNENYGTPTVTVTGGTFDSANGKAVASYANPKNEVIALTGFIKGGTFSSEPDAAYLAPGCIAVENDGTYTVVDSAFDISGTVVNVNNTYAQLVLDGVFGDITGKTINFTENINDVLVLARPTKYAGSGTRYVCNDGNSHGGESKTFTDANAFLEHFGENEWHSSPNYYRTLKDVTFTADEGVTVAGFTYDAGHFASSGDYDYVRDHAVVNSNNGYYNYASLEDITFDGLTVAGRFDAKLYQEGATVTDVTFDGCTFTGVKDAGGAAIKFLADSQYFTNTTVKNCTINNYNQGVYIAGVDGATITDNKISKTAHNAIALQSNDAGNPAKGEIKVAENYITNVSNRAIRLNYVGSSAVININNNVILSSGDGDGQLIKATAVADGAAISLENNYWDGKAISENIIVTLPIPTKAGIADSTWDVDVSAYVASDKIVKKNSDTAYVVVAKSGLTAGTYMDDPSGATATHYYVTNNNDGTWTVYYQAPAPAPDYSDDYSGSSSSSTTTKPTAPSVPESSKPNVSAPTTSTETKTDTTTGSTTTTETKQDGTKVETTTNKDGSSSTTASKTETTTNKDGSTTTTTATNTSTTTATGDKVTEEKVEAKVENKDGSTTTTTSTNTTTQTASGDKVTEEKVEKVEEKKDGTTTTTTTTKTETQTASGEKVTVKAEEKVETTETKTTTTKTTETKSTETGLTVTEKKVEETVKAEDGKEITTSTTETKSSDGSKSTTVVDETGKTTAEVQVSAAAVNTAENKAAAVTLPMPAVETTKATETAPEVKVSVPASASSVKVEIPVAAMTAGTVAVIVHADGTEEIVRTSGIGKNGVKLTVEGDATIKIVDNSKDFGDVPETYALANSIDFMSARGLFEGDSQTTFKPHAETTVAQTLTVLARLSGENFYGAGATSKGAEWGAELGLYADADAAVPVTREQTAVMMWKLAGSPKSGTALTAPDADQISADALEAMMWAVEQGIFKGNADGTLNPTGTASRAHVAAFAERYVNSL